MLTMSDSVSDMCVGFGTCLAKGVCVVKVHNAIIVIYLFDSHHL